MKIYLDTNILIFLLTNQDELSANTQRLIGDYANVLQTSSVCVHELIHLCQIGKLEEGKRKKDRIRPENIQGVSGKSMWVGINHRKPVEEEFFVHNAP